MIAALFCGQKKTLKSHYIFHHSCDTDTFNAWLKHALVPDLKEGSIVFMDRASFHKSRKTTEIIEAAGCTVEFIPKYSPCLNSIEKIWHEIKSLFRKIRWMFNHPREALNEAIQKIINKYS